MKLIGWIALVALVLLALFAAANWSLLTAPATLSFLVFSVEGPLGLILFGATLVLAVLFATYALSLRTTALVETRRHMKALETQRALADSAEASRFTALGAQLEREHASLRATIAEAHAETLRRADALQDALTRSCGETGNALFANIGQIDDKLDRLEARK
jgi:uncharacterized integral membrane protein